MRNVNRPAWRHEFRAIAALSGPIALTNLAPTPVFAAQASAAVVGTSLDHAAITAAAGAAGALMAPAADGRGTVQFRASVGGIMLGRALQRAFQRASA